jgi:nucleoside-triphosphatase THEP1
VSTAPCSPQPQWQGDAIVGLLTGPVGVGKTTVAERVVGLARRQGWSCGGLLAPALKDPCGQKAGIWGVEVHTGQRRLLARTDRELGGPAVGPYSFDAEALAWGLDVVCRSMGACDLLVVDEIGKLELWQDTGLAPALLPLAAGAARRSLLLVRDVLLLELQVRLGSVQQIVFEVNEQNRGQIAPHILTQLLQNRFA